MTAPDARPFPLTEELVDAFGREKYVLSRRAATVVFLAGRLAKPILIEGPAGVGKTDLARVLARVLDRRLIRLQCYEGLDEGKALYEWQYGKQLLYTQIIRNKIGEAFDPDAGLAEAMERLFDFEDVFFSPRFLLPRPLLEAIRSEKPVVLLIDEVDKSDAEFEAFLLEVLSDYTVSIPEIGTLTAATIPVAVLTSNSSREMSDALKRRCLHLALDFPDRETEAEILGLKVPGLGERMAGRIAAVVERLREMPLKKAPSVSESLDWAAALTALSVDHLSIEDMERTLGVILKYESDLEKALAKAPELLRDTEAG